MRLHPSVANARSSIRAAFNLLPIRTDAARRSNPRRLRRVADRWLPLGHASLAAKIVVLRHGGHERPVITRGSKHLRFRYLSTKTATVQLGEGKGEEFLALFNEVSSTVHDYECHPFEIHLVVRGRTVRYRPDAVRQMADGSIELIEAKRTSNDLQDPEYREVLAAVAELCRQCGWKFRDLYLDDIFGPKPKDNPRKLPERVTNVRALFGRRTMALTRQEQRVASRAASSGAPLDWSDLRDRLAPDDPLQGDAVIEHLLAAGRLSTDLDQKFGPSTLLTPCRPLLGVSSIRL